MCGFDFVHPMFLNEVLLFIYFFDYYFLFEIIDEGSSYFLFV